jgi:RHS repeat-associated protein
MNALNPADQQNPSWQRTVLLASDSSQSVIAEIADGKHMSIAYAAYGEQSAKQPVATALGFNGQLREISIGVYILGNGYRAYNPKLMRFHSPDSWSPFGRGELNAYMYCVGDPVNRVDPTGHFSWRKAAINTFNFFFGGPERTGPHTPTLIQGRTAQQLGGLQPERTGEGKALAAVGAAVAGGAPVHRSKGLYPGGEQHTSARWGTDNHFVGSPNPVTRPAINPSPSRTHSSVKQYDGPSGYRPRREQNHLQGGEAPTRKDYFRSRESSLSSTGSTWTRASSTTAASSISSGRLSQASDDIRELQESFRRLDTMPREDNGLNHPRHLANQEALRRARLNRTPSP